METKLKLTASEKLFWQLSAGYSLLCLAFYLLWGKGAEILFLSDNYSEKLHNIFSYITQFAEWEGVVFIAAILLMLGKRHLLAFGIVFLIETVITQGLKFLIANDCPRKWAILNDVSLPVLASELQHNSFPSGHTALVFCMMYCLLPLFKQTKWAILFFIIAVFVSFSRVYLMAHFVIDTGAGAMVGCGAGFVGIRLFERIVPQTR